MLVAIIHEDTEITTVGGIKVPIKAGVYLTRRIDDEDSTFQIYEEKITFRYEKPILEIGLQNL